MSKQRGIIYATIHLAKEWFREWWANRPRRMILIGLLIFCLAPDLALRTNNVLLPAVDELMQCAGISSWNAIRPNRGLAILIGCAVWIAGLVFVAYGCLSLWIVKRRLPPADPPADSN